MGIAVASVLLRCICVLEVTFPYSRFRASDLCGGMWSIPAHLW